MFFEPGLDDLDLPSNLDPLDLRHHPYDADLQGTLTLEDDLRLFVTNHFDRAWKAQHIFQKLEHQSVLKASAALRADALRFALPSSS